MLNKLSPKSKIVILIMIFLVAFFLRFFKLGEIPFGFYQDETAIGYNAYSINETGKDEYGETFPLYFKSFGDYKLPVYIYSVSLSERIFGLTEFAVRFPSALFGFLTVIIFYFFVRQLVKNNNIALVSTLLLAINPWHIHYNRATFEVSIVLFLFVTGSYLLLKSFSSRKTFPFILGTILFVIGLYTYNLTRLLAPALYVVILFINRADLRKLGSRATILAFIISAILLIPFIVTLFSSGGINSAGGTLIYSSAVVQASLLEFRSYVFESSPLLSKLFFNKWILTDFEYFRNVARYFSFDFFFVSGSGHGNHGIGNVGQFYLFESITIILGIIMLLAKRHRWGLFLLLWTTTTVFVASLTREAPHATRSFFLILPLIILSAFGLMKIVEFGYKLQSYRRIVVMLVIIGFVFYNLIYYFSSYYFRFPSSYATNWRSEDKAVSLFIKDNIDRYDKIIIDSNSGFVYTSLLFYMSYPPMEFQDTSVRLPDDSEGFSRIESFGKFEFRDIDWDKDSQTLRTLIVTTVDQKPEGFPILKEFRYPKRPVVISVGQKILQYPVEETAYVLIGTK